MTNSKNNLKVEITKALAENGISFKVKYDKLELINNDTYDVFKSEFSRDGRSHNFSHQQNTKLRRFEDNGNCEIVKDAISLLGGKCYAPYPDIVDIIREVLLARELLGMNGLGDMSKLQESIKFIFGDKFDGFNLL